MTTAYNAIMEHKTPTFWCILVCFITGILGNIVNAQEINLLSNGGFEEPYITLDGDPLRDVAAEWNPWHMEGPGSPSWQNRQPSYSSMDDEGDVREGSFAQRVASFYETHEAGMYQVVETGITIGMKLEFSAYAHVWSNASEDRSVSEYDGDVFVQVGIDPSGGSDPSSNEIIWSTLTERYDEYIQHVVSAVSKSNQVTVYVRSLVLKPQAYSQILWDDAILREVEATTGTASVTPIPNLTVIPRHQKLFEVTKTATPD